MLMVLAFILLVAWLLGVVGTYTVGAFVHVLLVMAHRAVPRRHHQRPADRRLTS